jgi:hypothetical protein
MNDEMIWRIRWFIYDQFAKTGLPADEDLTAEYFGLERDEALECYSELHRRHALLLDLDTNKVRMAWPFSGIPTRFRVEANGVIYWANCAWDSLGIPAEVHFDAEIEAFDSWSNEAIRLAIHAGQPIHSNERIFFSTPFNRWYDDLIFT